MNRLPEIDREIARLEAAMDDPDFRPADPEVAADLALRRELAALDGPRMPEVVHRRIRNMVRMRRRAPWAAALAATLAGVVVTAHLALSPPGTDAPSGADARELQEALEIIGRTGRRAVAAAGDRVAPHVESPGWLMDRIPLLFPQPAESDRSNNHEPS